MNFKQIFNQKQKAEVCYCWGFSCIIFFASTESILVEKLENNELKKI